MCLLHSMLDLCDVFGNQPELNLRDLFCRRMRLLPSLQIASRRKLPNKEDLLTLYGMASSSSL